MTRYKAAAHVLGLNPGDEFESDDDYYTPFADGGYLVRLHDEGKPPEVAAESPRRGRRNRPVAAEEGGGRELDAPPADSAQDGPEDGDSEPAGDG